VGHSIRKRIIILSGCFLVVAVLLHVQPRSERPGKIAKLNVSMNSIPGWETGQTLPLDPRVVKELELDDYLMRDYRNPGGAVDLYIGYYFSSKKVGAAHDPLVCFPGQGWALSMRDTGKLPLNPRPGESITFSRMVAERHAHRELIVYWFQSYDETNADTFSQKISLFWKKLTQNREDNAFVRVTATLGERTVEEGMDVISKFIDAFYPVFLKYVRDGNERK
jgi:EpsI family protein